MPHATAFHVLVLSVSVVCIFRGVKNRREDDSSVGQSSDVLKAAKELVKKTKKKVVVTETKKFAGQEIRCVDLFAASFVAVCLDASEH